MEEFKPILCIICHEIASDENCRIVEDSIKSVLDILLFKELIEVNTSVICGACYTKVIEAYRFKEICTGTEDIISRYVNCENGAPIDVKGIYLKERDREQLTSVSDDDRICRLCMQIATSGFTSVRDLENDLLCQYIPEVNFSSTKEPIVCTGCAGSLKTHTDFLINCFGVQKFEDVLEAEAAEGQFPIKIEEVAIKSEGISEGNEDIAILLADEPVVACQSTRECSLEQLSEISTYNCDTCDYIAKSKEDHMYHQLEHKDISVEKMYRCDKCYFASKHRRSLYTHQQRHKNITQPQVYKCDKCSYQTHFKAGLSNHRATHTDTSAGQVHKCDSCSYKTKHIRHLVSHQLIHKDASEVQMYKCERCDFQSKHRGNLASHELIHKSASQVQIYACDTCSFETKYLRSLVRHEQTHKDISKVMTYKCDLCNYGTKYKVHLESHKLKHKDVSEVQMYKCGKCNFESKRKGSLSCHEIIHKDVSEVQMYKCDECSFETKYMRSLVRHERMHKNVS